MPEGDVVTALRHGWGLEVDASTVEMPTAEKTVAVRGGAEVVAVWPGYLDRIVGIAVDIGSTTIAGHLVDLATGEVLASAGRMNPQIRFGEDLMSRVSYVMLNPGGDAGGASGADCAHADLYPLRDRSRRTHTAGCESPARGAASLVGLRAVNEPCAHRTLSVELP